ncbi:MAG: sigma-70 family RNA polymerase sigma factor [Pseudonocardia sp.]|nr:sigma-70 family RNA polymerase sigma factor [Pseudonocardia sp.]
MGEEFEEHRAHLLRVGYRITGSLADAEDAVQDAWLRWSGLTDDARAAVREPRAWLTTVVARLCLDRLRSATARRETYVGPWLPEPLVTTGEESDPLTAVVRDEGVRIAAMLVLERLGPAQRVAFVLHDGLALPFAEIAGVLGCSEATARQHASRARRIVADAGAPPPRSPGAAEQKVLAAFVDAIERADRDALVEILHPDVVLASDGGGKVTTARRVVAGADRVARLLAGLLVKYDVSGVEFRPVLVNGEPGFVSSASGEVPGTVTALTVVDGRITALHQVMNPEKLRL